MSVHSFCRGIIKEMCFSSSYLDLKVKIPYLNLLICMICFYVTRIYFIVIISVFLFSLSSIDVGLQQDRSYHWKHWTHLYFSRRVNILQFKVALECFIGWFQLFLLSICLNVTTVQNFIPRSVRRSLKQYHNSTVNWKKSKWIKRNNETFLDSRSIPKSA